MMIPQRESSACEEYYRVISVDWSFQTAFFLEIESSQHQKVAECSVHYLRK